MCRLSKTPCCIHLAYFLRPKGRRFSPPGRRIRAKNSDSFECCSYIDFSTQPITNPQRGRCDGLDKWLPILIWFSNSSLHLWLHFWSNLFDQNTVTVFEKTLKPDGQMQNYIVLKATCFGFLLASENSPLNWALCGSYRQHSQALQTQQYKFRSLSNPHRWQFLKKPPQKHIKTVMLSQYVHSFKVKLAISAALWVYGLLWAMGEIIRHIKNFKMMTLVNWNLYRPSQFIQPFSNELPPVTLNKSES